MNEVTESHLVEGVGPQTPKQAFTNRETHPLVLNLMLLKEFGTGYLGWEPETCWLEIGRTWNTTISEISRNKIQAIRTCHVSDDPYDRWEVFEKVSVGLAGLTPKFDLIQKLTPYRAALSLDIMLQLKEDTKISDEVYKYVAAVMMDHGFVYGHGVLSPSNKYVSELAGTAQQSRIKRAIEAHRKPVFDGKNEDGIQVMKSISVNDFLESSSRTLLTQLKKLLP